jgi:geranylgeranyl reductase family protein
MTHDVMVVGAGPAGAWTAYRLARGGARVLLVDPSHPREKPCGGGVTGRALALVHDAPGLGAVPTRRIRTVRFIDDTGSVAVTLPTHEPSASLLVASRSAFDGALLNAAQSAGVHLARTRIADVTPVEGGFELRDADGSVFRGARLVGADGANSLVRRRLATPFSRAQLSIGTGFFADGVSSDEIAIQFVADPPGYIWSFPRPDHLAIGVCAQGDTGCTAESLRTIAGAWIRRTEIGAGATLRPYSWPIPSLRVTDLQTLTVAGRGWLLVGDAAGLVDPLTREGIYFALQSAECAADAILSAAPYAERTYADRVHAEILDELERAARLKAGFFRPRFTGLLTDALRQSGAIRAVVADLVAGTQSYKRLKSRLVRTLEVRLAWTLVTGSYTRREPARWRQDDRP